MKKLILITGVFLSTSLWADMDKICYVEGMGTDGKYEVENTYYIRNNCERNNLLEVRNIKTTTLYFLATSFCRFDREILINKPDVGELYGYLSCVLYDKNPRLR